MFKKKSVSKSKPKVKKVEVVEEKKGPIYSGPNRNFRFLNVEGSPDKYNWVTMTEGDEMPDNVALIVAREKKLAEAEKRVEDLRKDLADDGKRNFSHDDKKEAPGRPKK